VVVVALALV